MKFFTIRKKRNKTDIATLLRPTLFLISAIALFVYPLKVKAKATEEQHEILKEAAESMINARYVVEKLQASSLEILPPSIRLDMLDYWDVDSVYKASNVLGGQSWIINLTENYAKLQLSPVSTLQIKILPEKKERVIMTIYTVGDEPQAADSEIKFYNEELQELPAAKYFKAPEVKSFFDIPRGSATKMKEIEQMIPFPTIAYNANPDNDNLQSILTVEQFVNQDDWNIAKLFLKPEVILEWKNGKYK